MDRFGRGARVLGITDWSPDDDKIGAVLKGLGGANDTLLVVYRAILHRADTGDDDHELVAELLSEGRNLQTGRNYAVAADLQRTLRARAYQCLHITLEAEVFQVTLIQASQHRGSKDLQPVLFADGGSQH